MREEGEEHKGESDRETELSVPFYDTELSNE